MINNHYVLQRTTEGIMIDNHYVLQRTTEGGERFELRNNRLGI
jgi:hypothetical protein